VSLVGCQLLTGRMHQIRVHLAARGWPIVGDRVYAAAAAIALQEHLPIARQALHAWRLAFPHPADRRLREIVAPLPDDMRRLLDAAGLTS
jgi:23S rRNA pseudouridine1911/1915/1917 synthase